MALVVSQLKWCMYAQQAYFSPGTHPDAFVHTQGFDAGNLAKFFADPRSQTADILDLSTVGRYCYKISATVVCGDGAIYDGGVCVKQNCRYLPNAVENTDHVVANECTSSGVDDGASCNLGCEWSTENGIFTQPASFPTTGSIMTATCNSTVYNVDQVDFSDQDSIIAKCVDVGFNVTASKTDNDGIPSL